MPIHPIIPSKPPKAGGDVVDAHRMLLASKHILDASDNCCLKQANCNEPKAHGKH